MKVLFICEHNLGRSQMARAWYNYFTGTEMADSAGTATNMYQAKTLGEMGVETRTMRVMSERGFELADSMRQQITPELSQQYDKIVSFLSEDEMPEWLNDLPQLEIWSLENYPAADMAGVRRLCDEIFEKVLSWLNAQNLIK